MSKALIVVDVQNDFCPGGSLAVENGDRIITNINKLTKSGKFDLIIATQDWHPKNHISFASRHKLNPFTDVTLPDFSKRVTVWPDHCIRGTKGSELRNALNQDNINLILRKGMNKEIDSYSAFIDNDKQTETGLRRLISVYSDLYVTGIATDVCVKATVLDSLKLLPLMRVHLIADACASVAPEEVLYTYESLGKRGVTITDTKRVLKS